MHKQTRVRQYTATGLSLLVRTSTLPTTAQARHKQGVPSTLWAVPTCM